MRDNELGEIAKSTRTIAIAIHGGFDCALCFFHPLLSALRPRYAGKVVPGGRNVWYLKSALWVLHPRAEPQSCESRSTNWPCEPAEHETDHRKTEEGSDGPGITFEVAGEAAIAAGPGEGALDHPPLGHDDEAMGIDALDDLEGPRASLGGGCGGSGSLISRVGEDALDEGKGAPRLAQHVAQAIAILDVGGGDDDKHEEGERVDQDVALATRDLLARIVPLRVHRGPPFCAALALWLSTMAAVGLAS